MNSSGDSECLDSPTSDCKDQSLEHPSAEGENSLPLRSIREPTQLRSDPPRRRRSGTRNLCRLLLDQSQLLWRRGAAMPHRRTRGESDRGQNVPVRPTRSSLSRPLCEIQRTLLGLHGVSPFLSLNSVVDLRFFYPSIC